MGLRSESRSVGASTSDDGVDPNTPVLRINQLDALELDGALEQLVWSQFSQCFQHCRPGLLTPVEPELRALLQLLLWRFTLYSSSHTVGQSLLSLRYHDARSSSSQYRPLSSRQKLAMALLAVVPRWLQERSHSLTARLGTGLSSGGAASEGLAGFLRRCFTVVSGVVQLANLVNFLVFLREGRHPVLAERVVGARAVFSKANVVRDVNYQYMNRELLWHGFAEFLIFLLPLINTKKLKDSLYSAVFGAAESPAGGAREGADVWKECGICGEWPTMPHSTGCPHVFCYYCIRSHVIADERFACPKCGALAGRPEPAKYEINDT